MNDLIDLTLRMKTIVQDIQVDKYVRHSGLKLGPNVQLHNSTRYAGTKLLHHFGNPVDSMRDG